MIAVFVLGCYLLQFVLIFVHFIHIFSGLLNLNNLRNNKSMKDNTLEV